MEEVVGRSLPLLLYRLNGCYRHLSAPHRILLSFSPRRPGIRLLLSFKVNQHTKRWTGNTGGECDKQDFPPATFNRKLEIQDLCGLW